MALDYLDFRLSSVVSYGDISEFFLNYNKNGTRTNECPVNLQAAEKRPGRALQMWAPAWGWREPHLVEEHPHTHAGMCGKMFAQRSQKCGLLWDTFAFLNDYNYFKLIFNPCSSVVCFGATDSASDLDSCESGVRWLQDVRKVERKTKKGRWKEFSNNLCYCTPESSPSKSQTLWVCCIRFRASLTAVNNLSPFQVQAEDGRYQRSE